MQFTGLLRHVIQALALTIFAYQIQQAFRKYLKQSVIASVSSKSIAEARLPQITVCLKTFIRDQPHMGKRKALQRYLAGVTDKGETSVSWDGLDNKNATRLLFKAFNKENFKIEEVVLAILTDNNIRFWTAQLFLYLDLSVSLYVCDAELFAYIYHEAWNL